MAKPFGARVAWAAADAADPWRQRFALGIRSRSATPVSLNIFEGAAEIQAQVIARAASSRVRPSGTAGALSAGVDNFDKMPGSGWQ